MTKMAANATKVASKGRRFKIDECYDIDRRCNKTKRGCKACRSKGGALFRVCGVCEESFVHEDR
jgi:hypothetical protein